MIQLNLLPDVKLEYIKAQRSRRLVLSVSVIVSLIAVALLVVLFSYDLLQKKHISDLSKDINNESSQLQNEPNINDILTVQNQLASLSQLHAQKPSASSTFNYLNELTPVNVDITDFTVDFTKQTFVITGTANALSDVNQYVDTLKLTTYTTNQNSTPTKAFSNVVLTNFGLTSTSTGGKPASYTISLSYDPNIFNITYQVTLSVPSTTTTRLETQQPTDLFAPVPANSSKGGH